MYGFNYTFFFLFTLGNYDKKLFQVTQGGKIK